MARNYTKPRKDRVFTDFRRQKLLRKRISLVEVGAGLACLVFLLLSALWIRAQRDAWDPRERDLDMALLEAAPTPADLYNTPVRRWRDPALPAATAAIDVSPFPPAVVSGGWQPAGRVQAFTAENLYEKINGQAEQYLTFGFRTLHVLSLERPAEGVTLDLFLYDQGSSANSLGLYAEQRGDRPVRDLGALRYTPTALGAYGAVGRHVVHVIGSEESVPVAQKTEQLLGELSRLADASPPPPELIALTDHLGLPFGSIAYTPANAFQLGFAERFWFGRLPGAAEGGGTARCFLHRDESPAAARDLHRRLVTALSAELLPLDSAEDRVLQQHRYLKTFYAMQVRGPIVFGVEDHPRREGALEVMARLEGAVDGVASAAWSEALPTQRDDRASSDDGSYSEEDEP